MNRHAALRLFTLIFSVLLLIPAAVLCSRPQQRAHSYAVRQDLSVYFTNADAVIDSVREALRQRSQSVTLTYRAEGDHMADIAALTEDLMQFVYAETDAPDAGDYLRYQTAGYALRYSRSPEGSGYAYQITVVPEYYTDLKQEQLVTERVRALTKELNLADIPSESERALVIYDYVRGAVSYDTVHRKNAYYHLKSTAYGALFNRTATCQGYAVLLYRLLREAGLKARIVTGYAGDDGAEPEYHAWTLVCIDGLYYNLDATWDRGTEAPRWFLRCDAGFPHHQRTGDCAGPAFAEACPMAAQDYPLPMKGALS